MLWVLPLCLLPGAPALAQPPGGGAERCSPVRRPAGCVLAEMPADEPASALG
ncbi:MAG: hypothetical protein RIB46_15085 [Pseudomonadales bacterium]